jgi:transcriptional regulator with XRE-family HTH domain
MSSRSPLAEPIRSAIRRDGRSLNQIAQATDVSEGVLSRFMRGERDITLGTAEKLCKLLGLKLKEG